ncbi:MAG: phosphatidylserine decarboxylase family protein [bacterium]|nr:phosphatidylserine decarboxylase family protein [bacterium]MDD5756233.1 phosphatidylserine decarboxylase family protein [bacterium]
MGINKAGFNLIKIFLILSIAGYILSYWVEFFGRLSIFFVLITIFLVYFFRDPNRKTEENDAIVYSPADGEVIEIKEVTEDKFLKTQAMVIKIFMTPLDVHVQRAPIKGRVEYLEYKKGKFMPANLDKASAENEQNLIGIENNRVKVLVKQIAGILARRIVWWVNMQQGISQGERLGMIKLGSQVDIYIPMNIDIKVKVKEKVKAGLTVLGEVK